MEDNVIIDEAEINEDNNIAPRGLRLANFIIDYLIILMLVTFSGPFIFVSVSINDEISSTLISILYYVAYYFLFERATNGKTPAKYITRTRAIKENGEKASTMDFLKRSLARIIPFEPFSIFGDKAWHDAIPEMTVIKERV